MQETVLGIASSIAAAAKFFWVRFSRHLLTNSIRFSSLTSLQVAVKFERHGARCPQLRHEYKVYRELTNCHGFCSVYYFGTQDNYNVMVMDLLGPSLEDLFNKCSRRFSLKTVLQIADQLLERVDTLHSRHLIHRDIKPANFVIGLGEQGSNVYCVDFGLSKRYRHPKNLQHIPHRDGRSLTGTPRYASINNHLGIEQSRRDDLESIGYVLIYFLKGSLPWQGLKAKNAQKKYRLILEKKQQVSIAQLCQGCPSQFAEFLAYTRSLKFDAKPDFPYLRKLFRDLYHAQGCANVGKLWDWDDIDSDYVNQYGDSAPGPMMLGSTPPRPSTAAAVAATGHDSSDHILEDDNYEISRGKSDRPSTAGALGARQTSSWGFSSGRPPTDATGSGMQQSGARGGPAGGSAGIADPYAEPQRARPHTAHGERGNGPAPSGMGFGSQMPLDPRTGKPSSGGEGVGEDEDAHVVAGARAMMRYRRTRASSAEGGSATGGPTQSGPGPQSSAQAGAKGWDQPGYGMPPQQQSKPSAQQQQLAMQQQQQRQLAQQQQQQQQQLLQQQQQMQAQQAMQRNKQPAAAPSSSAATGWLQGGGAAAQDRPKSASATVSFNVGWSLLLGPKDAHVFFSPAHSSLLRSQ